MDAPASSASVRRLDAAMGTLTTAVTRRMDAELPWYRALGPEHRSWVVLVAQAGIGGFVEWVRRPTSRRTVGAGIFGGAPRELARVVTLEHTVELVRLTIGVVEERIDDLAGPGEARALREAVLLYSREVAFAAALVYAQAAEARGAWDARLEALVVDAVVRGEVDDPLRSRAAALGWGRQRALVVVVGPTPDAPPQSVVDDVHRTARALRLDVLAGVQGDRLVAVVGGDDPLAGAAALADRFGAGPVVVGPVVDDLLHVGASAAEALAGLAAAPAWPDAPRPVPSGDLLAERALAGDPAARTRLVETVVRPLRQAGGGLLETLSAFLETEPSLEATARALFVHPNTVRYRLRRAAEVCGLSATLPRDALALRLALLLGRLSPTTAPAPPSGAVARTDAEGEHTTRDAGPPSVPEPAAGGPPAVPVSVGPHQLPPATLTL